MLQGTSATTDLPMSFPSGSQLVFLLAGALAMAVFTKSAVARTQRNPRSLPYPPGPKGKPFVGNLSQIPRAHAWLGYHEMAKEHGEQKSTTGFTMLI